MDCAQAKQILLSAEPGDLSVYLPKTIIAQLQAQDLPDGVRLAVGVARKDGVIDTDFYGLYLVRAGGILRAEREIIETRKYWYGALGLEHYVDLIRRSVETSQSQRGDMALTHFTDDGAFVMLQLEMHLAEQLDLGRAYAEARGKCARIDEVANSVVEEVSRLVASAAERISGWGTLDLDRLVDAVDAAGDADAKGRALEELMCRLWATVPGINVTPGVRTATEEIDISLLNGSQLPWLQREKTIILVECKNWNGRCGKNEFVAFKEKLANRCQRCSLGFLVSWNGFAATIKREMLRGSREELLVVPLEGGRIRQAVRTNSFNDLLQDAWAAAINL